MNNKKLNLLFVYYFSVVCRLVLVTHQRSAFRLFVLTLTLLCSTSSSQANNFTISDLSNQQISEAAIQIWPAPEFDVSVDQLLRGEFDDQFVIRKKEEAPLESEQFHWATVTLSNDLPTRQEVEAWVLHFSLMLTQIDVFAIYENGEIAEHKAGCFIPYQERTFHPTHKSNLVQLKIPEGETVKLYIKFISERKGLSPGISFTCIPSNSYFKQLKNFKQINGLFVGFVLMILIYNLFLFAYNRDKAFIYYSGYLLSLVGFTIHNTGDMMDMTANSFLSETPKYYYLFKLIMYVFIGSYLTFLRVFLRLPILLPKWDKIYRQFIIWVVVPVMLLDFTIMVSTDFNHDRADIISITTIFSFLILSTIFLFPLYKTRDKKGYFIIAGFIAMSIGIVLTIFARVQTVEYSTFFFKLGTILEIIIFSLGLAHRQREREEERQKAAFDLEKSQLLQQQKELEKKQLEELDGMRTAFYTNITHEFRTPLTVIMGMSENIKGHSKEKELIARNSDQLLKLINQLLDLSKLESGHLPLQLLQTDIIPYLRYLTESFYSLAKEKDITVQFRSTAPEVIMDFDETKIQYIINNLLSNAIKFTSEGGLIEILVNQSTKGLSHYLNIQVKDNGIGIPPHKIEHVFDRFYQAHENKETGTGIGLSLTKQIVELLNGSIYVKSTLGQGSSFFINLPIQNEAKTPEQFFKNIPPEQPVDIQKPALTEQATVVTDEQAFILVIEDSLDVADYINSILQKDYQILHARDGAAGIDKAFEIIPDLIITDVMMPRKNGYEVTKTLKEDQRTSHIPIIMLTAKANEEDKLQGLKSGADAYLSKPFRKAELLIRIDNLMNLKKEIQTRYNVELKAKFKVPADPQPIPKVVSSLDDAFILKVRRIIDDNMEDSELTINDLCKLMGLSHSQLYRKLKALTNKTPIQFIRFCRLQKAKMLLQNGDHNVSETAYKVGFNDPNYFSRMFTQEFGTSPSEVRP